MAERKWFLLTNTRTIKLRATDAEEAKSKPGNWPYSWMFPDTEDIQVEELPEDA
jgi:hypothetical protein